MSFGGSRWFCDWCSRSCIRVAIVHHSALQSSNQDLVFSCAAFASAIRIYWDGARYRYRAFVSYVWSEESREAIRT